MLLSPRNRYAHIVGMINETLVAIVAIATPWLLVVLLINRKPPTMNKPVRTAGSSGMELNELNGIWP